MQAPEKIELIMNEVAVLWKGGKEDYFKMDMLRAASPSAENQGERDLLGNVYGGDGPKEFSGITVTDYTIIGGYAVQFKFSDGHNTGLFSWEYLRDLSAAIQQSEQNQSNGQGNCGCGGGGCS